MGIAETENPASCQSVKNHSRSSDEETKNTDDSMHRLSLLCLAAAISQSLATDCNFSGGFAKRQKEACAADSDAPVQCKDGFSHRCCPKGYFCRYTSNDNAYCCPTDKDCYDDLVNVPRVSFFSTFPRL